MTRSEQAWADHECGACGGTGLNPKRPVMGRIRNPRALRVWQNAQSCPICRGAGRISDRMPVADAMADAETLLAMNLGQRALYYSWSERQWDSRFYGPGAMYEFGCYLARAAFRAVPGLRGA